jgi:hypothetical protein
MTFHNVLYSSYLRQGLLDPGPVRKLDHPSLAVRDYIFITFIDVVAICCITQPKDEPFYADKVNLFYEPGYVIPCVAKLTE